jgi:hypothetical protein
VEVKETVLRVWDIVNLCIRWKWTPPIGSQIETTVASQIQAAVVDIISNTIAVFVSNGKLYFFDINSDTDRLCIDVNLSSGSCTGFGLFVPKKTRPTSFRPQSGQSPLFEESQLLFMNLNQELLTVANVKEPLTQAQEEEVRATAVLEDMESQTPFAKMLIEKRRKALDSGKAHVSVKAEEMRAHFDDQPIDADLLVDKMFLKVPSHVLPPLDRICGTFLSSLLISSKRGEDSQKGGNVRRGRGGPLLAEDEDEDKHGMESEDEEDELKERMDDNDEANDQFLEVIGSFDNASDLKEFVFEEDYNWLHSTKSVDT